MEHSASQAPRDPFPRGLTGLFGKPAVLLFTTSAAALRGAAHTLPQAFSNTCGCTARLTHTHTPHPWEPHVTAPLCRDSNQPQPSNENRKLPAPPLTASGACALPLACNPRPPLDHSAQKRQEVRETGVRCFKSLWKRSTPGSERHGRQSLLARLSGKCSSQECRRASL